MFKYLTLPILLALLIGCNQLPEEHVFKDKYYLLDQDSSRFVFPDDLKNEATAVGYIFTNCPDICPLTTHNLQTIQKKAKEEGLKKFQVVAISFDPFVDKPSVLKKYAEIRDIDLSNFTFLTGEENEIKNLMHNIGIIAVPSDTSKVSGKDVVFYAHTDRISLMDENHVIRKHFSGSRIKVDNFMKDLRSITN